MLENLIHFAVQRHKGQMGKWADHRGCKTAGRMTQSYPGSGLGQIPTIEVEGLS